MLSLLYFQSVVSDMTQGKEMLGLNDASSDTAVKTCSQLKFLFAFCWWCSSPMKNRDRHALGKCGSFWPVAHGIPCLWAMNCHKILSAKCVSSVCEVHDVVECLLGGLQQPHACRRSLADFPLAVFQVWWGLDLQGPGYSPQRRYPHESGFWRKQQPQVQEWTEWTLCILVTSNLQGTSPWCSSTCSLSYAPSK